MTASAALAPALMSAADDLDPVLQYKGTINDSGQADYPFEATIDCSTGTCYITATATDTALGETSVLSGPEPVALMNGSVSTTVASIGDPCQETFISGGPFTVTAQGSTLTGQRAGSGSGVVDCPDGSSVEYASFDAPFSATLVSGDSCFLTGDCTTSTPTAAPVTGGDVDVAVAVPEAATPSTLSALPTAASAFTLANAAWAATLTVVLVILVALPSHLLNTALETGSERLMRRLKRPQRRAFSGLPVAAGAVVVAALISACVDPSFGFSASSVRVFLSILASFVLDVVIGWFVLIWLVKRATPGAVAEFRCAPLVLLLVVAAVLFSRITGFQPGLVYGLVAGVAFGAVVATADRAKVTLVGLGYSFTVAIIGWVGYSIIVATQGDAPAAVTVFVREMCSAMAIGGIAALPIALVPLRGLAGYDVFRWNRWVWGSAYAVGFFGFFFVLMPLPFSWDAVGLSLWAWVAIYLGYALVAVGAWAALTRPWVRSPEATHGGD